MQVGKTEINKEPTKAVESDARYYAFERTVRQIISCLADSEDEARQYLTDDGYDIDAELVVSIVRAPHADVLANGDEPDGFDPFGVS